MIAARSWVTTWMPKERPRLSAGPRRLHRDRSPRNAGVTEPWPSASTTGAKSSAFTSMLTEEGHGFLHDKGFGARRTRASSPPSIIRMPARSRDRNRTLRHQRPWPDRGQLHRSPDAKAHGFVRDKGRGARRDEGVFTTIDFPGAATTLALAINNRDQILGTAIELPKNRKHGFLLQEVEFIAIDQPGCHLGGQRRRNRPLRPQRSWPDRGPI